MKRIGLILFCLFFYSAIYSQHNDSYFGITDIYVLKVELTNKVLDAQCPCSMIKSDRKDICSLYKIVVDSVMVQRDNSVYTKDELLKINYLILREDEKIEKRSTYTIFCKNSSSKEYIVANTLFDNDNYDLNFSPTLAYLSGLHSCYSLNFWQKLSLFFSLNKTKTINKLAKKVKNKDPFLNHIRGR